ncbi:hypothetical protein NUU61_004332 [Penicillium alfredii]|uniref:Uncharacterized protein n=1 Tax=Penicillium alfredii TaxID=1506179 RepID=A0A9W9FLH1_9EURO|nr:uncharacterized protein NUU61_004332 [Penicillium alfredii]KAJ5102110.1 hypothetical protein NUU61_004332 [Penicillium alfredii]
MALARLPGEIVELIAAQHAEVHPPSFISLACANKTCCACCLPAAKSVFFHAIKIINAERAEDLAPAVKKLTKKLKRANSFGHVRWLVIDKELLHKVHHPGRLVDRYEWQPPTMRDLRFDDREDRWGAVYRDLCEPPYVLPVRNEQDLEGDHKLEDAWSPGAKLRAKMPAPDLSSHIWQ